MKQFDRFCTLVLTGLLVMSVTSCKDDDEATPMVEGPQVYFNNNEASTIEVDPAGNSFQITIHRQDAAGRLVVPITYTPDKGGEIYNVPSEVVFEDGASEAIITVTYDPADIQLGSYVGGTIEFDRDALGTPFGENSISFKAGASPWVDYLDEDGNQLFCTYREALLPDVFAMLGASGMEPTTYRVPLQIDKTTPGRYRLVNPYGVWAEEKYGGFNEPGDYDTKNDYYMVINATDPEYVWMEECYTGANYGLGKVSFGSYVALFMEMYDMTLDEIKEEYPGAFGYIENNIIYLPPYFTWAMEQLYDNEWLTYQDAQYLDQFAIALPGGQLKDYSTEVEYLGRWQEKGLDDYARLTFKLGEDVTNATFAMIPLDEVPLTSDGNVDFATFEAQLQDGKTYEMHKLVEKESTQDVYFYDSGSYVVAILLYEDGELKQFAYYVIELINSGDATVKERFEYYGSGQILIGVEDLSPWFDEDGRTLGFLNPFRGEIEFPYTQEATLYRSITIPNHYKIDPWWGNARDENRVPFFFYWNQETGEIYVEQDTPTEIPYDNSSYVLASDVKTLFDADMPCTFEDGVFTFNLAYYGGGQAKTAEDLDELDFIAFQSEEFLLFEEDEVKTKWGKHGSNGKLRRIKTSRKPQASAIDGSLRVSSKSRQELFQMVPLKLKPVARP